MSGKEFIFIALKSNPYDRVGEWRVGRLSFRIKNTSEYFMVEFVLVKEHELEIGQVTNVRKCLKIVFGQVQLYQVRAPPKR